MEFYEVIDSLGKQLTKEVVHGPNPCSHYKLLHFVEDPLSKSPHLFIMEGVCYGHMIYIIY
jgi:hypothetical protein